MSFLNINTANILEKKWKTFIDIFKVSDLTLQREKEVIVLNNKENVLEEAVHISQEIQPMQDSLHCD